MKVLVTGASGQLGRCIYDIIESTFDDGCLKNEYYFATHDDFDITDMSSMINYMYCHFVPDCIINCAAYTNVDGAEDDAYTAFKVNSEGVKNIADICKEYNIMLIHISTDYVYKDKLIGSCSEEDDIEPLNIYGQSKRDGEIQIINAELNNWYIFRTSWLYSEYGNNFVTKIVNKFYNNNILFAVINEMGSPTYARRLAEMIISIIEEELYVNGAAYEITSGIYNFSGEGVCTRYDFANTIVDGICEKYGYLGTLVNPITQTQANEMWGLKAKRPLHVPLNNSLINAYLNCIRNKWNIDLAECLNRYDILRKSNDRKILYEPLKQ